MSVLITQCNFCCTSSPGYLLVPLSKQKLSTKRCLKSVPQYEGTQHSSCTGKLGLGSLYASQSPSVKVFASLDSFFGDQMFHQTELRSDFSTEIPNPDVVRMAGQLILHLIGMTMLEFSICPK